MTYPKFVYPKPLKQESGCKVGWMFYATREEAEECSRIAQEEAAHKSNIGYDFGWSWPGSIEKMQSGTWRVTVP